MTPLNDQIDAWISRLERELTNDDPALRRDAVADATEHLAQAYEQLGADPTDAQVHEVLESYGDPAEIADSYREADQLISEGARPTPRSEVPTTTPESPVVEARPAQWFSIIADPEAWSALLFMLLSLPIGIATFTWVVAGGSVAGSLLILIIGIPLALVFLATTRGIALLDGRLVEALLGERMPRRGMPAPRDLDGFLDRVKYWLCDRRTWTSMVYLVLRMPLGIAYFVLVTVIGAVSLGMATLPITMAVTPSSGDWDPTALNWISAVIAVPAGVLGWFGLLHLARAVGDLHGRFAKLMLVGGEGRASRRNPVSLAGSLGHAAVFLLATALVFGVLAGATAAYEHANSSKISDAVRAADVTTVRIDAERADLHVVADPQLDPGEIRIAYAGRVSDDVDRRSIGELKSSGGSAEFELNCPDSAVFMWFSCDFDVTLFVSDRDEDLRLVTESNTGDIDFANVSVRSVDIEGDTGDVDGELDAERLSIELDTGDVELRLGDRAETVDVRSDTGDVELTVSGSWRTDLRSDTGEIENLVADDPDSDRRITVETDTGDIELDRGAVATGGAPMADE